MKSKIYLAAIVLGIGLSVPSCGPSAANAIAGDKSASSPNFPYGFKNVVWTKQAFQTINQLYLSGQTEGRGVATLSADIRQNMTQVGKIHVMAASAEAGGWRLICAGRLNESNKPYAFMLSGKGGKMVKSSESYPTEGAYNRILASY